MFPSIIMVTISYGSLYVPSDQVIKKVITKTLHHVQISLLMSQIPGRMTLTITSTLTLVSMSTGLFNNSPRTSYLKAIDVFLLICFLFTISVLVEFCAVIFISRHRDEVRE